MENKNLRNVIEESVQVMDHFFEKIKNDPVVTPIHISIYLTIFRQWILSDLIEPMKLNRETIMAEAKVSSYGTYYKKMKELSELEYLRYIPNHNPDKGSYVYMRS